MGYIRAKRYESYWLNAAAILCGAIGAAKTAIRDRDLRRLFQWEFAWTVCSAATSIPSYAWLHSAAMSALLAALFFMVGAAVDQRLLKDMRLFDADAGVQRATTGTYDDADFLTAEQEDKYAEEMRDIERDTQFVYGYDKKGRLMGQRVLPEGNLNMAVVAPSGFYKGVSFVVLNGLQMIAQGASGVIASTKDDIFSLLNNIARESGYRTFLLSLRQKELGCSDRINIIDGIGGSLEMAKAVSLAIIQNTSLGERPDYWYRGESNLNAALLAHFSSSPDVSEGDRNLPGLLRFLSMGAEYVEDVLSVQIAEGDPAWNCFNMWRGGDKVPKMQVVQGLGYRYSSFIGGEEMDELLSENDIRFEELAEGKCLIFLVASDGLDAYKAISSMFFTMLFFKLEETAMEAAKESGEASLPGRVKVVIDEAAAVGEIPRYADTLATCRGYGFDVVTMFQDLPQLEELYGKKWRSIMNNSSVKMLLHTDDEMTAKYFSTLCRTFTGIMKRKGSNGAESGSEVRIELMSVSRILGMDPLETLVIISSAPGPMKLKKQMYYADIPGSRLKYVNKRDGKAYRAHPLLKYAKPEPAVLYVPHRKSQIYFNPRMQGMRHEL